MKGICFPICFWMNEGQPLALRGPFTEQMAHELSYIQNDLFVIG